MYFGHDGAYTGCQDAYLASERRGMFNVQATIYSMLNKPLQILASASYDASILLFADDPDADWGPFQKLQPSLPAVHPTVAPGVRATDNDSSPTPMQEEAEETSLAPTDEFTIPALKDPETIWSLAFSPCGMFLASGGDNGGIRIWARG